VSEYMSNLPNENDAKIALDDVGLRQRQVVAMINIPWWYWWSVGIGWIVLGVIADLHNPWATSIATLLFGAIHATIAQRFLDGRHSTRQLSVRADMVNRHIPAIVLSGLLVLAALTTGIAIAFATNHVGRPVTLSSVIIAAIVVSAGPGFMGAVRRHADARISS
jgi:hypothetical protein